MGSEQREAGAPTIAPTHARPAPSSADRVPGASPPVRFAELLGVASLAVAQPALSVLGANAQFFVIRRASVLQTTVLVAWLVLMPPLVAFGIELLARLVSVQAQSLAHVALCSAFAGLIAAQVARHAIPLTITRLVPLGLGAAALAAFAYLRLPMYRRFLRLLALSPVLFVAVFVCASPGGSVVTQRATLPPVPIGFATPHRIVVVVMDEFPEVSLLDGTGHVDEALFPNFAALADNSTWYRNSTTVAGFTEDAVPAILTGRYPTGRETPPTATRHPRNLFSMLRRRYAMNGHETVTHLCVAVGCEPQRAGVTSIIGDGTQLWWDSLDPARVGDAVSRQLFGLSQAAHSVDTARTFVESLRPARRPRLDVLHVEMPHYPWNRLASMQSYETGDGTAAADGSTARAQHLLQVQVADVWIGRIIARLRSVGAFDDAMVVVTADHGISFRFGEPHRSPSSGNLTDVMWTPLFIKYPGQSAGTIDDRPAESVDIVPTIAAVVGAGGWNFDGRSLLGPPRRSPMRRLYFGYKSPTRTPKDLSPPRGRLYRTIDGRPHFAEVLRSRAAAPGLSASLRIFATGPFGSLVGRPAEPLESRAAAKETLLLPKLGALRSARENGRRLPWVWDAGVLTRIAAAQEIAITLDGRVVAVAPTTAPLGGRAELSFLVPPALVRGTHHTVHAFVVRGDSAHPRLQPIGLH